MKLWEIQRSISRGSEVETWTYLELWGLTGNGWSFSANQSMQQLTAPHPLLNPKRTPRRCWTRARWLTRCLLEDEHSTESHGGCRGGHKLWEEYWPRHTKEGLLWTRLYALHWCSHILLSSDHKRYGPHLASCTTENREQLVYSSFSYEKMNLLVGYVIWSHQR